MLYKISVYIPESHLDSVKEALFTAGGGKLGEYSHCCWQTLGEGQFMPLEGSSAYIGKILQVEKISEYKVELVCSADLIDAVIKALKKAHPYEQPAYQVIKMEDF